MRPRSVIVTAAALLLLPATAWAAEPTTFTGKSTRSFAVKPATIAYTGDGSALIGGKGGTIRKPGHLRWTTYGAQEGRARGAVYVNDCEPSCADGTFGARAVRVRVFRPRDGHFTRLTLRYRYGGRRVVDRRTVERGGDGYVYGIAR